MVFLRIVGWECVIRGNKSERTDSASEGVMTCGNVMIGRDIVVGVAELKSCICLSRILKNHMGFRTFFKRFVASIRTSVSGRKLCTAPKYPTRFCRYFGEDMTSRT